ncbi:serine-rich adhesin for platelets-like [Mya arenaria]|uniref:serine-rich adhesin for platelets-like n=1 Tax=Mya arenaria TaxID=6604 RepID=UPI0022E2D061|nr:serine-rich adhesin for platelets-like [Mya arenaria]
MGACSSYHVAIKTSSGGPGGWPGVDCLTNIDDCVGHRCAYGATCLDGHNFYSCLCPPGRTEINDCASTPYKNGGQCRDASNSFRCECPPGFAGLLCEVELDECRSGPCLNKGLCQDGIASFKCHCPSGFYGDRCQYDVNECLSNPCVEANGCINLPGDYICQNCDVNINECSSDPCQNNGWCIDEPGSFTCLCEFGFAGPLCEESIDNCQPNYCTNGSTCENTEDRFVCHCTNKTKGFLCDQDRDECVVHSDICGENGKCVNSVGDFTCACVAGYEGGLCEREIDECELVDEPCLNEGTCVDLIGEYECLCNSILYILICISVNLINIYTRERVIFIKMSRIRIFYFILELSTTILTGVDASGYIEVKFRKFQNYEGRQFDGSCCNKGSFWGWGSSDDTCENECDHTFVVCMGNATQSSSMTSCEYGVRKFVEVGGNRIVFDGHVGDSDNPVKFPFGVWPGVVKVKIDVRDQDSDSEYDYVDHVEYQYNTHDLRREIDAPVHDIVLKGTRTRFDMELKVFCETNYYGPACDLYCRETDDDTGHFRCDPASGDKICKLGWTGVDCLTNIDDCVGHRCAYGATCLDGHNFYSCLCPPGRTGFTCQAEINECASIPCKNGGQCRDASNSFRCECPPGFAGLLCEVELDECRSGPCLNKGVCQDGIASFKCLCPSGFYGDRCQHDVNECLSNPCVEANGCINLPGDYICPCRPGYTGKNCDVNIDECLSDPCQNNGWCIDEPGSFTCLCDFGFTGPLCEESIDNCQPNYCTNGSTCENTEDRFVCHCTNKTKGFLCDQDIDECVVHSDICGENGKCVNSVGDFTCTCEVGYEGGLCEREIDECELVEEPCLNEGTCVDLIGEYECLCVDGFTGSNCSVEINECESYLCENGGTCVDLLSGFSCTCPEEYSGKRCETFLTTSKSAEIGTSTTSTTPTKPPTTTTPPTTKPTTTTPTPSTKSTPTTTSTTTPATTPTPSTTPTTTLTTQSATTPSTTTSRATPQTTTPSTTTPPTTTQPPPPPTTTTTSTTSTPTIISTTTPSTTATTTTPTPSTMQTTPTTTLTTTPTTTTPSTTTPTTTTPKTTTPTTTATTTTPSTTSTPTTTSTTTPSTPATTTTTTPSTTSTPTTTPSTTATTTLTTPSTIQTTPTTTLTTPSTTTPKTTTTISKTSTPTTTSTTTPSTTTPSTTTPSTTATTTTQTPSKTSTPTTTSTTTPSTPATTTTPTTPTTITTTTTTTFTTTTTTSTTTPSTTSTIATTPTKTTSTTPTTTSTKIPTTTSTTTTPTTTRTTPSSSSLSPPSSYSGEPASLSLTFSTFAITLSSPLENTLHTSISDKLSAQTSEKLPLKVFTTTPTSKTVADMSEQEKASTESASTQSGTQLTSLKPVLITDNIFTISEIATAFHDIQSSTDASTDERTTYTVGDAVTVTDLHDIKEITSADDWPSGEIIVTTVSPDSQYISSSVREHDLVSSGDVHDDQFTQKDIKSSKETNTVSTKGMSSGDFSGFDVLEEESSGHEYHYTEKKHATTQFQTYNVEDTTPFTHLLNVTDYSSGDEFPTVKMPSTTSSSDSHLISSGEKDVFSKFTEYGMELSAESSKDIPDKQSAHDKESSEETELGSTSFSGDTFSIIDFESISSGDVTSSGDSSGFDVFEEESSGHKYHYTEKKHATTQFQTYNVEDTTTFTHLLNVTDYSSGDEFPTVKMSSTTSSSDSHLISSGEKDVFSKFTEYGMESSAESSKDIPDKQSAHDKESSEETEFGSTSFSGDTFSIIDFESISSGDIMSSGDSSGFDVFEEESSGHKYHYTEKKHATTQFQTYNVEDTTTFTHLLNVIDYSSGDELPTVKMPSTTSSSYSQLISSGKKDVFSKFTEYGMESSAESSKDIPDKQSAHDKESSEETELGSTSFSGDTFSIIDFESISSGDVTSSGDSSGFDVFEEESSGHKYHYTEKKHATTQFQTYNVEDTTTFTHLLNVTDYSSGDEFPTVKMPSTSSSSDSHLISSGEKDVFSKFTEYGMESSAESSKDIPDKQSAHDKESSEETELGSTSFSGDTFSIIDFESISSGDVMSSGDSSGFDVLKEESSGHEYHYTEKKHATTQFQTYNVEDTTAFTHLLNVTDYSSGDELPTVKMPSTTSSSYSQLISSGEKDVFSKFTEYGMESSAESSKDIPDKQSAHDKESSEETELGSTSFSGDTFSIIDFESISSGDVMSSGDSSGFDVLKEESSGHEYHYTEKKHATTQFQTYNVEDTTAFTHLLNVTDYSSGDELPTVKMPSTTSSSYSQLISSGEKDVFSKFTEYGMESSAESSKDIPDKQSAHDKESSKETELGSTSFSGDTFSIIDFESISSGDVMTSGDFSGLESSDERRSGDTYHYTQVMIESTTPTDEMITKPQTYSVGDSATFPDLLDVTDYLSGDVWSSGQTPTSLDSQIITSSDADVMSREKEYIMASSGDAYGDITYEQITKDLLSHEATEYGGHDTSGQESSEDEYRFIEQIYTSTKKPKDDKEYGPVSSGEANRDISDKHYTKQDSVSSGETDSRLTEDSPPTSSGDMMQSIDIASGDIMSSGHFEGLVEPEEESSGDVYQLTEQMYIATKKPSDKMSTEFFAIVVGDTTLSSESFETTYYSAGDDWSSGEIPVSPDSKVTSSNKREDSSGEKERGIFSSREESVDTMETHSSQKDIESSEELDNELSTGYMLPITATEPYPSVYIFSSGEYSGLDVLGEEIKGNEYQYTEEIFPSRRHPYTQSMDDIDNSKDATTSMKWSTLSTKLLVNPDVESVSHGMLVSTGGGMKYVVTTSGDNIQTYTTEGFSEPEVKQNTYTDSTESIEMSGDIAAIIEILSGDGISSGDSEDVSSIQPDHTFSGSWKMFTEVWSDEFDVVKGLSSGNMERTTISTLTKHPFHSATGSSIATKGYEVTDKITSGEDLTEFIYSGDSTYGETKDSDSSDEDSDKSLTNEQNAVDSYSGEMHVGFPETSKVKDALEAKKDKDKYVPDHIHPSGMSASGDETLSISESSGLHKMVESSGEIINVVESTTVSKSGIAGGAMETSSDFLVKQFQTEKLSTISYSSTSKREDIFQSGDFISRPTYIGHGEKDVSSNRNKSAIDKTKTDSWYVTVGQVKVDNKDQNITYTEYNLVDPDEETLIDISKESNSPMSSTQTPSEPVSFTETTNRMQSFITAEVSDDLSESGYILLTVPSFSETQSDTTPSTAIHKYDQNETTSLENDTSWTTYTNSSVSSLGTTIKPTVETDSPLYIKLTSKTTKASTHDLDITTKPGMSESVTTSKQSTISDIHAFESTYESFSVSEMHIKQSTEPYTDYLGESTIVVKPTTEETKQTKEVPIEEVKRLRPLSPWMAARKHLGRRKPSKKEQHKQSSTTTVTPTFSTVKSSQNAKITIEHMVTLTPSDKDVSTSNGMPVSTNKNTESNDIIHSIVTTYQPGKQETSLPFYSTDKSNQPNITHNIETKETTFESVSLSSFDKASNTSQGINLPSTERNIVLEQTTLPLSVVYATTFNVLTKSSTSAQTDVSTDKSILFNAYDDENVTEVFTTDFMKNSSVVFDKNDTSSLQTILSNKTVQSFNNFTFLTAIGGYENDTDSFVILLSKLISFSPNTSTDGFNECASAPPLITEPPFDFEFNEQDFEPSARYVISLLRCLAEKQQTSRETSSLSSTKHVTEILTVRNYSDTTETKNPYTSAVTTLISGTIYPNINITNDQRTSKNISGSSSKETLTPPTSTYADTPGTEEITYSSIHETSNTTKNNLFTTELIPASIDSTRDLQTSQTQVSTTSSSTIEIQISHKQVSTVSSSTRDIQTSQTRVSTPSSSTIEIQTSQAQVSTPSSSTREIQTSKSQVSSPSSSTMEIQTNQPQDLVSTPSSTTRKIQTSQTQVLTPSSSIMEIQTSQTQVSTPSSSTMEIQTSQTQVSTPSSSTMEIQTSQTQVSTPSSSTMEIQTSQTQVSTPSSSTMEIQTSQTQVSTPSSSTMEIQTSQTQVSTPSSSTMEIQTSQTQVSTPSSSTMEIQTSQTQVSTPSSSTLEIQTSQTQVSTPSSSTMKIQTSQTQVSTPSSSTREIQISHKQVSTPSSSTREIQTSQTQVSTPSSSTIEIQTGQTQVSTSSSSTREILTNKTQVSSPSSSTMEIQTNQQQVSTSSSSTREIQTNQPQASTPLSTTREIQTSQTQMSTPSSNTMEIQTSHQTQVSTPLSSTSEIQTSQTKVSYPSSRTRGIQTNQPQVSTSSSSIREKQTSKTQVSSPSSSTMEIQTNQTQVLTPSSSTMEVQKSQTQVSTPSSSTIEIQISHKQVSTPSSSTREIQTSQTQMSTSSSSTREIQTNQPHASTLSSATREIQTSQTQMSTSSSSKREIQTNQTQVSTPSSSTSEIQTNQTQVSAPSSSTREIQTSQLQSSTLSSTEKENVNQTYIESKLLLLSATKLTNKTTPMTITVGDSTFTSSSEIIKRDELSTTPVIQPKISTISTLYNKITMNSTHSRVGDATSPQYLEITNGDQRKKQTSTTSMHPTIFTQYNDSYSKVTYKQQTPIENKKVNATEHYMFTLELIPTSINLTEEKQTIQAQSSTISSTEKQHTVPITVSPEDNTSDEVSTPQMKIPSTTINTVHDKTTMPYWKSTELQVADSTSLPYIEMTTDVRAKEQTESSSTHPTNNTHGHTTYSTLMPKQQKTIASKESHTSNKTTTVLRDVFVTSDKTVKVDDFNSVSTTSSNISYQPYVTRENTPKFTTEKTYKTTTYSSAVSTAKSVQEKEKASGIDGMKTRPDLFKNTHTTTSLRSTITDVSSRASPTQHPETHMTSVVDWITGEPDKMQKETTLYGTEGKYSTSKETELFHGFTINPIEHTIDDYEWVDFIRDDYTRRPPEEISTTSYVTDWLTLIQTDFSTAISHETETTRLHQSDKSSTTDIGTELMKEKDASRTSPSTANKYTSDELLKFSKFVSQTANERSVSSTTPREKTSLDVHQKDDKRNTPDTTTAYYLFTSSSRLPQNTTHMDVTNVTANRTDASSVYRLNTSLSIATTNENPQRLSTTLPTTRTLSTTFLLLSKATSKHYVDWNYTSKPFKPIITVENITAYQTKHVDAKYRISTTSSPKEAERTTAEIITEVGYPHIRHSQDLLSNNTYPHPRKEQFEYAHNASLTHGKATLSIQKIKVTVYKTYEYGKRVVLQTYQRVKDISTQVIVTTYTRSRELLQKALKRVEALWQYCKDGVDHYIVKPLLNAQVFIKERFNNAYYQLSKLFERGQIILENTVDNVSEESNTYFETLTDYYTGVYRQYSSELRNIFDSLKVP